MGQQQSSIFEVDPNQNNQIPIHFTEELQLKLKALGKTSSSLSPSNTSENNSHTDASTIILTDKNNVSENNSHTNTSKSDATTFNGHSGTVNIDTTPNSNTSKSDFIPNKHRQNFLNRAVEELLLEKNNISININPEFLDLEHQMIDCYKKNPDKQLNCYYILDQMKELLK